MPRSQKDASGGAGGGGCIIQKMKNRTHKKRDEISFHRPPCSQGFNGKKQLWTHTHTLLSHTAETYTQLCNFTETPQRSWLRAAAHPRLRITILSCPQHTLPKGTYPLSSPRRASDW